MGCRCTGALVALVFVFASLSAVWLHDSDGSGEEVLARASQEGNPPEAKIAWLPDIVSNGTWWSLDGSGSYDRDGFILNYTWHVSINNQSTYLYGMVEQYKFKILGLYTITLTVRDNDGNLDDTFRAVFSIRDADDDGLPDWWEDLYWPTELHGLDYQSAGDDPDGDGYSNADEFDALTDPTLKSSHPKSFWDKYWLWITSIIVAAAAAIGISVPLLWKGHRDKEKRKIEFAIEIDKELSKGLDFEEDEKKP